MDNVPSIRNLNTEQALDKIHRYLQSNKQEIEYWLQMVNTNPQTTTNNSNIFGDISQTDIDEWNKIKEITNNLGNVIAEKLQGNINAAIANIMNGTSTVTFNDIGIYIHDQPTEDESTWAMMLSARGFMIANAKITNPTNQTWSWNWRTFGTGEGFTADEVTTGTLNAITLNACNILASNITSGTLKSVTIETAILNGNEINGGKITGTEIIGASVTAGIIDGAYISGGTIEATTINASTFNTALLVAPKISAAEIKGGIITGTILNGTEINGGTITGAVVQSMGEEGDGVALFDKGYYVFAPGNNVIAAELLYDNNGSGTVSEAQNRVFFSSKNGYAMKIHSDDDMSITADGTIYIGDCIFMGSTNIGAGIESIDYYTNGFKVNKNESFKWIDNTKLMHINTGNIITITEHAEEI